MIFVSLAIIERVVLYNLYLQATGIACATILYLLVRYRVCRYLRNQLHETFLLKEVREYVHQRTCIALQAIDVLSDDFTERKIPWEKQNALMNCLRLERTTTTIFKRALEYIESQSSARHLKDAFQLSDLQYEWLDYESMHLEVIENFREFQKALTKQNLYKDLEYLRGYYKGRIRNLKLSIQDDLWGLQCHGAYYTEKKASVSNQTSKGD